VAKSNLPSELLKSILEDLMRRYPRGKSGKLRHYHYQTHIMDTWGNKERLIDPTIDSKHPKLPKQEAYFYLGHPLSELWGIPNSDYDIRDKLANFFPELTRIQRTTRSRRIQRRINKAHHLIRQEGAPGIYDVRENYGSDYRTYLYAGSTEEARQLAQMFLAPAMTPRTNEYGRTRDMGDMQVRFESFDGPESIGEWHAKSREAAASLVCDIQKKIDKFHEQIQNINAFQLSAEMVVANISAEVAQKSLENLK